MLLQETSNPHTIFDMRRRGIPALVLHILELELAMDYLSGDVLPGNWVYDSGVQEWDLGGNRRQAAAEAVCPREGKTQPWGCQCVGEGLRRN